MDIHTSLPTSSTHQRRPSGSGFSSSQHPPITSLKYTNPRSIYSNTSPATSRADSPAALLGSIAHVPGATSDGCASTGPYRMVPGKPKARPPQHQSQPQCVRNTLNQNCPWLTVLWCGNLGRRLISLHLSLGDTSSTTLQAHAGFQGKKKKRPSNTNPSCVQVCVLVKSQYCPNPLSHRRPHYIPLIVNTHPRTHLLSSVSKIS